MVWSLPCVVSQQPRTVAGAILAQAADSAMTILDASGNMVTSITQLPAEAVKLPQCQQTSLLTTAGGFPDNWGQLSAEAQASHPINLPIMQLAFTVYQSPSVFENCIKQWGVSSVQAITKTVPTFYSNAVAHVVRVGNERLFVLFKGSDATNWIQNMECAHTEPVGDLFGARGSDLRVHSGFWAGWKALETDVTKEVLSFAKEAPTGKVYVVGHSLGAALGALAALRLVNILPASNEVAGVWLLGSPRVGNPTWKAMYNALLLPKTLRVTNFLDFAARMPRQQQSCSTSGGVLNVLGSTTAYSYAHVGRSLLMCPTNNGLNSWTIAGMGSEVIDCPGLSQSDVDGSAATHLLGSYFDSWRRGYYARTGSNIVNDPRVTGVLCEQCTMRRGTRLTQISVPARAGGPVTCGVDASCTSQAAWNAATAVRQTSTVKFGGMSVCNGYICSDS